MYADLHVAKEWGLTYREYLEQPPAHRALMAAYVSARGQMASVEYQEQRERRAVKGL